MAVKINHDSFPENFLNVLKVDPKSKMSSTKQEGVHRHDATWKLPVVDHLASATERKVQDLGSAFGPSAKRDFAKSAPACRPRLGHGARGSCVKRIACVASGEKSDRLSVYKIDQSTGKLGEPSRYPVGNGANWVEIVDVQ